MRAASGASRRLAPSCARWCAAARRRRAAEARPVGLGSGERRALAQRSLQAARGELLVLARAGLLPGELLGLKRHAPRAPVCRSRACGAAPRSRRARSSPAPTNASSSTTTSSMTIAPMPISTPRPMSAAVQHRPMADVRVVLEARFLPGEAVQHAAVLHVAAGGEHDATEVPAQRGVTVRRSNADRRSRRR